MQYTRGEMRLLPRGWGRGVLYVGPVAGAVRGVVVAPGTEVVAQMLVTHTLVPRQRGAPSLTGHAIGDARTPLPPGHTRLTRGTRITRDGTTLGHVTRVWCDRLSLAVTDLLVSAPGGLFGTREERILPLALVAAISHDRIELSKGYTSLAELAIYRDDVSIERDVRLALAERIADPQARRAVKVRVEDGHVSLGGAVETVEVVTSARQAVAGVRGVRGYTNDLIALEALGQRVEVALARLIAQGRLLDTRVRVLAEHAIVYLEGSAPSVAVRAALERTAISVPGVRVVVNDIAVDGEPPSRSTGTGPLVRNR